ncbi:hypothetical protein [Streptomyces sp. AC495_CC817]|uniref:hypothetical protein n=1 Tax=Streptomyces sp. AC495_CC817 TaxID=2823900 RepID=UPI001C25A820|nr:hypothetical protein [Streptomyces sp. AC495_CC817]
MTVTEEYTAAQGLVPGAHRVIRVLDVDEGPFRGALVAAGTTVMVQLDAESLSGWAGWEFAGAEHVAAPADLVRRSDGHDVLLPWCTERITTFLGRRRSAGAPLTGGEVSTVIGSMLRGIEELGERERAHSTGDWWITSEGRPVFVLGEGASACGSAAAVVRRLREGSPDRALCRTLEAICSSLEETGERRRIPRALLERWETEVVEIAAPRVLRTDVHPPDRAGDVDTAIRPAAEREPARLRRERPTTDDRGGAEGGVLRRVRDAASTLFDATKGMAVETWARRARHDARAFGGGAAREGARRVATRRVADGTIGARPTEGPKRGRRGVVLLAGGLAVVVLLGGLLWPSGATGEGELTATSGGSGQGASEAPRDSDDGVNGEESASSSPSALPEPDATVAPSVDSEDPVVAARGLIREAAECGRAPDAECAAVVVESGSQALVRSLADIASQGDSVELTVIDVYGDVAVVGCSGAVRDGEEPTPQRMLVLVRADEKWLVRDAYDVADQPG